jgi:hypothetical protein
MKGEGMEAYRITYRVGEKAMVGTGYACVLKAKEYLTFKPVDRKGKLQENNTLVLGRSRIEKIELIGEVPGNTIVDPRYHGFVVTASPKATRIVDSETDDDED